MRAQHQGGEGLRRQGAGLKCYLAISQLGRHRDLNALLLVGETLRERYDGTAYNIDLQ